MNLSDFANMVFNCTKPTRICVFDCDEHRDDYRNNKADDPLLTIETNYKLRHVLHERFATVKVDHFYAHGEDELDVIIVEDEYEPYLDGWQQ